MSVLTTIAGNEVPCEMNVEFKPNKLASQVAQLVHQGVKMVTKRLKLQKIAKNSDKRKLVISTNWLSLFGYQKHTAVVEEVIGQQQGLIVRFAHLGDTKTKKVYSRQYRNNTNELLMDIRSQTKLDVALGDADSVEIIFQYGEVTILPVYELPENVINKTLNVQLRKEGEIYADIIYLISTLKKTPYQSVELTSDNEFFSSQECSLLSMQLRRMGYDVVVKNQQLHAHLPTQSINNGVVDFVRAPIQRLSLKTHQLFNQNTPLSTVAACTGGVDCYAMEQDGFNVSSILEFRPVEQRDITKKRCKFTGEKVEVVTDKTELAAISAAVNTRSVQYVFNEDIYLFNAKRYQQQLAESNFFHISLQCSDFSPLKTLKEREKAISTLSSTRDMIFPALDLIEQMGPVSMLVENVPNFGSSVECKLFNYHLSQLGYKIHQTNLSGEHFAGAYTKRKRCFVFASLLPTPFKFPEPDTLSVATSNVWRDVIIPSMHELRDVTHTSSVQKGIKTGRIRTIEPDDKFAPTIFKAQNRQVKDSVYVKIHDKYYFPSVNMLKKMMGIGDDFNLSLFSQETKSELVGQSVEVPMHKAIMKEVKSHIMSFVKTLSMRPSFNYIF